MHLEKSKEIETNMEDYFDLFWKFIFFTDEAHFNPSMKVNGRILQEKGTHYKPENMQEMEDLKDIVLYFAAAVSWYQKGPLIFYNDENDLPPVVIKKSSKPCCWSITEIPEEFEQCLKD